MRNFVVYDLEYTSWEGARARKWSGPGEHREIVQIGAVLLDSSFNELKSLEILVRPRINPKLSDYFIALTGITQQRVDAQAVDALTAIAMLEGFSHRDLPMLANGGDAGVLAENCVLLGIDNPFRDRAIDISGELLAACGLVEAFSCDLPRIFGLGESAGQAHTALADARNVAAALAFIRSQSSSKAFL